MFVHISRNKIILWILTEFSQRVCSVTWINVVRLLLCEKVPVFRESILKRRFTSEISQVICNLLGKGRVRYSSSSLGFLNSLDFGLEN